MIETRFCTSCQTHRVLAGGKIKPTRQSPRWVCKQCAEKKSESAYKNRATDTDKLLLRRRWV